MQKTRPPRKMAAAVWQKLRQTLSHDPALLTLSRAAGAALGAFALSGATLLGRPLPLSLAFLAAMPFGILSICAFCGTAAGTLLFCGPASALSTLAAAFLIAAESFIFRSLLPREKHWFLPLSAAFFYALLTFFPLLAAKFPPFDTIYAGFCAAAIFLCTYLFLSVPAARSVLLLIGALSAASGILLPGTVPLGVVAAAAVCCRFLGSENGVFCAAALGLTLDLASVEPAGVSGAFVAAALVCSMQLPFQKWLKIPVFLLCCTAFCVFLGRLFVSEYVACLLGAVLSLALPQSIVTKYARLPPDTVSVSAALRRAARVFSQMGQLVKPDFLPKSVTPAQIFDAAADELCSRCENRVECWQTAAKDTYLALSSAAAKFLPRGRCEEADFPSFFAEKCCNFRNFIGTCNEILLNYRKSGQYKAKLAETKTVLSRQYASLSRALRALSLPAPPATPVCYRAEVGYRACGVRSGHISGDFGCNFEYSGKFYLLLCDGMGTGLLASDQAEAAAGLLKQMLLSGFSPEDAIGTLGGVYLLRENGVFSTVDLLEADLSTADGTLYKSGAAPSFLKVGRRIVRLGGGSLPPGCENVTKCEQIPVFLSADTLLVLTSDGLDAAKTEEFLLSTRKNDPTELASELVSAAGSEHDDCSAAVLRFVEIPHS